MVLFPSFKPEPMLGFKLLSDCLALLWFDVHTVRCWHCTTTFASGFTVFFDKTPRIKCTWSCVSANGRLDSTYRAGKRPAPYKKRGTPEVYFKLFKPTQSIRHLSWQSHFSSQVEVYAKPTRNFREPMPNESGTVRARFSCFFSELPMNTMQSVVELAGIMSLAVVLWPGRLSSNDFFNQASFFKLKGLRFVVEKFYMWLCKNESSCLTLWRSIFCKPSQWRSQPKNFGVKMFDFRRITLFCLEKRLSKHKMTIFSKNLGRAMAPLAPCYAYESSRSFLPKY